MTIENYLATHLATKTSGKLIDRIQSRGFKLFHNGRDLRIWPESLSTPAQREYLREHRKEVFEEVLSLWSKPIRCQECRHFDGGRCRIGMSKSIHEGGYHSTDLHHCKGFSHCESIIE